MWRKLKIAICQWLECRTQRCDYYRHYLAYGPAELTHIGYHSAEFEKSLTLCDHREGRIV